MLAIETTETVDLGRRRLLITAGMGVAASAARMLPASSVIAAERDAIRPFQVHVPDAALVDLRHRIGATRWPERETVDDQSQGIQLGKIKPLVEYWGTGYD